MNTTALTELLNTDFCPWANQYVDWLKKPLGILILAAVASLLCGVFVAPQGLVVAGTIAATILLGMAWPWIGLKGLSCELRFPKQRGVEGESSPVEVIIRNRWPFPVWGLAIEEGFLQRQGGEDETAVALSGIHGWSKTKFCWNFQPECRGVYPTTSALIATEFPFGVWKARKEVETTGRLTVWPRTIGLDQAVLAEGASRSLSRPGDKRTGNEGDRIGVRAYRDGDSLRLVHWAQTAKLGRLIVSERQGPAQSSAIIAIDTDPAVKHAVGPQSAFESTIRIAASLCELLSGQNVSVLMMANGESWEVHPTERSRAACLDQLAALSQTSPLEVGNRGQSSGFAGLGNYDERFLVTSTSQTQDMEPGWKAIVVSDKSQTMDRSTLVHGGWIVVDGPTDPLHQFARRWRQAVRRAWKGTESRVGVAG